MHHTELPPKHPIEPVQLLATLGVLCDEQVLKLERQAEEYHVLAEQLERQAQDFHDRARQLEMDSNEWRLGAARTEAALREIEVRAARREDGRHVVVEEAAHPTDATARVLTLEDGSQVVWRPTHE